MLSCEVCETSKNTYFEEICKRLFLEVFYKKTVPKNFNDESSQWYGLLEKGVLGG